VVPAVPASSAAALSRRPITLFRPVASVNRQAASTFGPMDPAGNDMTRNPATLARRIGLASGVPDAQDEQCVRTHHRCEKRSGEVFVHDGFDAVQAAVDVPRHRDSSAAGANDERAIVSQKQDHVQLHDPYRVGRGDDPAPRGTVPEHGPAMVGTQAFGGRFVVDGADELRRGGQSAIISLDDCPADLADCLLVRKRAAECLRDPIPDHPLGLRTERVKWVGSCQRTISGALQREHPGPACRHPPRRLRGAPGTVPRPLPAAENPAGQGLDQTTQTA